MLNQWSDPQPTQFADRAVEYGNAQVPRKP